MYTPKQDEGGGAVWSAPECAVAVAYPPELLEEIRLAALESFYAFPRGGAEIGGVLFGVHGDGQVKIAAYRDLGCEHKLGPSFVLSPHDHERLAELVRAPAADPALAGLEPVGWYHSHTRSGIFLSGQDLEIHERYFSQPWQVALVLRPAMAETRAGFFVRDGERCLKADASYGEFKIEPLGERPMVRKRPEEPVDVTAAAAPARAPLEAEPPPPAAALPVEVELPDFLAAASPRRRRRWRWAATAALLIVAGAAGFATRDRWLAPAPARAALRVAEQNGQLQIRWDPSARPVRRARTAVLDIGDGDQRARFELDTPRLRAGTYAYTRRSGRVDVRLSLGQPDGQYAEEFAAFEGSPPAPSPPTPVEAGLIKQRDGLESELQQARTELINQGLRIQRLQRTVADLRAKLAAAPAAKPAPPAAPPAAPQP